MKPEILCLQTQSKYTPIIFSGYSTRRWESQGNQNLFHRTMPRVTMSLVRTSSGGRGRIFPPSKPVCAPPLSMLRQPRRRRRLRPPQPWLCETEFGELCRLHFLCGCWVHWGGGCAGEYADFRVCCVDVQEVRCCFLVVGVFVLRGTFVQYSLHSFCFVLVTVLRRFGILHLGGGCLRQRRIESGWSREDSVD